jgi:hypothetical protein
MTMVYFTFRLSCRMQLFFQERTPNRTSPKVTMTQDVVASFGEES